MATVNDRVKEIRKALSLSQTAFGERLGIKKSSVSSIESADCGVSTPVRQSICREFNVNREWLDTGVGDPFLAQTLEDEIMKFCDGFDQLPPDDPKVKIMKAIVKLPPEDWQMVRDLIELLKEE